MGRVTANDGPQAPVGYSEEISAMIAKIRTDLERFSEGAILENHGWLLAEASVPLHLPSLVPQPVLWLAPHPDG